MCIRDRAFEGLEFLAFTGAEDAIEDAHVAMKPTGGPLASICLLYTSDAADERSSVDLGGRRIIKKKNK